MRIFTLQQKYRKKKRKLIKMNLILKNFIEIQV